MNDDRAGIAPAARPTALPRRPRHRAAAQARGPRPSAAGSRSASSSPTAASSATARPIPRSPSGSGAGEAERRVCPVRLRRPARVLFRRRHRHRRRSRARVSRRLRQRLRPHRRTAGAAAQPLARVAALEPLARRRRRPTRASTTATATSSTGRGSTPPAMMYTCAYWKEGTTTLEEAQRNKMDHVCRKVRLAPGETFVDVGCGWGGLLFHAWEHYGALGTGINATTEQVEELRAEIARRGLDDKLARRRMRLPRDARPVRQAAVDRHARARGARRSCPRSCARTPTR